MRNYFPIPLDLDNFSLFTKNSAPYIFFIFKIINKPHLNSNEKNCTIFTLILVFYFNKINNNIKHYSVLVALWDILCYHLSQKNKNSLNVWTLLNE